jgi:Cu/Ag efflux pump CusA
MSVENRLDMELTGIKTPVGLKIQGPDVDRIQQIGSQIEEILGSVPSTRGIFALVMVADTLVGAIIKRRASGRDNGVAVIAEGIGERLDPTRWSRRFAASGKLAPAPKIRLS